MLPRLLTVGVTATNVAAVPFSGSAWCTFICICFIMIQNQGSYVKEHNMQTTKSGDREAERAFVIVTVKHPWVFGKVLYKPQLFFFIFNAFNRLF